MINYYTMWAHQIKTPISAFSMIVQSMDSSLEKTMMKQELFKIFLKQFLLFVHRNF